MSAGPEPERLTGARVTSEFFDVLSGKPFLGRTFTTGETQLGSNLPPFSATDSGNGDSPAAAACWARLSNWTGSFTPSSA
jgi:hypothetical protein